MLIQRAYKIELDPNNKQITSFKKHAGTARFVWNWGLDIKNEAFKNKEKLPTYMDLLKKLCSLKEPDFPWMYESSKCVPQYALKHLDCAYNNFFLRCKKKIKGKKGYPKFKSKGKTTPTFTLDGSIYLLDGGRHIQLPRIGNVRLKEINYIPLDSNIKSVTISFYANRWFISIKMNEEIKDRKKKKTPVVGVDLGINKLAVLSNGDSFENPRALKFNEKKLKRLQRQLARKEKGSKNREKAKLKLAKQHYKISNIRKDYLHKITSKIVNENQVVILEDLNVEGMKQNHCLAKAISDVGFYEFKRQIKYKCEWQNKTLILINRYFPSSKTCSNCGYEKEDLTLKERTYKCEKCSFVLDRDLNAAINIKREGMKQLQLQ